MEDVATPSSSMYQLEPPTTQTPNELGVQSKPSTATLKRAPKKGNNRTHKKAKRKLFSGNVTEHLITEMNSIIEPILFKMKAAGLLWDFCNMLRLINSGRLPLTNISLLLFMEVVRWYSMDTTSQMQYSEETMKFWKVMYRLFHGKALRFMGGLKSGTNEDIRKGLLDPQKTSINFAVPTTNIISDFEVTGLNIPKEVPPGIIKEALVLTSTDKSYVLSCDGKKVAPGLNNEYGDIDLFGYEEDQSQSLSSTKHRYDQELKYIQDTAIDWDLLNTDDRLERVKQVVKIVSLRLKDLRVQFMKQKLALKKFMKEGGVAMIGENQSMYMP